MTSVSQFDTDIANKVYKFVLHGDQRGTAELECFSELDGSELVPSISSTRQLLKVEEQAILQKIKHESSHQSYLQSILDKLHEHVSEKLQAQLEEPAHLMQKVLRIEPSLPKLIDGLSLKVASFSSIQPLTTSIPWLYSELQSVAKMPRYKRTFPNGSPVIIDSQRMALSYFGIENLKLLVPALAFRQWIPGATSPFTKFKRGIWEQALGSAVASKVLAKHADVNPNQAFVLGGFVFIGHLVLTRLYVRLFEVVHKEYIERARAKGLQDKVNALNQIEPSDAFLIDLFHKYSAKVSMKVIKQMDFKRIYISDAIQEHAEGVSLNNRSPLAKVLKQAIAYSQYRMLRSRNLIESEHLVEYFNSLDFSAQALKDLNATDLRSINITFETD